MPSRHNENDYQTLTPQSGRAELWGLNLESNRQPLRHNLSSCRRRAPLVTPVFGFLLFLPLSTKASTKCNNPARSAAKKLGKKRRFGEKKRRRAKYAVSDPSLVARVESVSIRLRQLSALPPLSFLAGVRCDGANAAKWPVPEPRQDPSRPGVGGQLSDRWGENAYLSFYWKWVAYSCCCIGVNGVVVLLWISSPLSCFGPRCASDIL